MLKNYWYVAAKSDEVSGKKPIRRMILAVPLVLWRSKNREIAVMLDRCNHRNAPLSEGKIIDDCVVCPYHGWTYNPDGQCVNIPSEGPEQHRIPNKKVQSFPVKEQYGLIWVWMGDDIAPDKELFSMPKWNEKGWKNYYMVTRFSNNVTDLIENFMDVPHTVYVHKGWFRDRKQICIKTQVERTGDSVLVSYDQPNDSIGFSSWIVNPKKLPLKHTDNFYMPNVTRVDYVYGEEERAFIITSTCTPVRPFETIVYTLISYKLGWLNPLAKLFLPAYTKKVIDQDVWIMDIHGKNIQHFKTQDYKSTQVDTMHLYIESLRNWAESGGVGKEPQPIKKEMEFWI